eukprot:SAG31_NODE_1038_length_10218_cov_16.418223_13_plen_184_part_00
MDRGRGGGRGRRSGGGHHSLTASAPWLAQGQPIASRGGRGARGPRGKGGGFTAATPAPPPTVSVLQPAAGLATSAARHGGTVKYKGISAPVSINRPTAADEKWTAELDNFLEREHRIESKAGKQLRQEVLKELILILTEVCAAAEAVHLPSVNRLICLAPSSIAQSSSVYHCSWNAIAFSLPT